MLFKSICKAALGAGMFTVAAVGVANAQAVPTQESCANGSAGQGVCGLLGFPWNPPGVLPGVPVPATPIADPVLPGVPQPAAPGEELTDA